MSPVQATAIWAIAAACILAIVARPGGWPEWVWAAAGAAILVAAGLLPVAAAFAAVAKGSDVYLFLAGMMLLAETARTCGLFDWLAAHAVEAARGSPARLFAIVYGVGAVVTVFLSNDATAVVLTPAVLAATKKARVDPLPHLFACALVANAASFVLPISNPANLVVYGGRTPDLADWLAQFALPAAVCAIATYAVLRWTQRGALTGKITGEAERKPLPQGGLVAAAGVGLAAAALIGASATNTPLGWPTFVCGLLVAAAAALRARINPWRFLRDMSWGVLPLVAGLFTLVEAIERTGLLAAAREAADRDLRAYGALGVALAGASVAFASNLVNNLPMGLLAGAATQSAQAPPLLKGALLIGVDVGPNLSVTGSLATILWLIALRREGVGVSAWKFLAVGAVVMPLTLAAALAAFVLQPH